ncbi:hypothetical protein HXX76_000096 [Chlamydomonas incerta]|uniref:Uncharacterized protein n=1 Tax=Chlamydomonas incerta TaxID=51695 RepID=A0A835WDK7_CHLIN|nr:hypothetical protein HXX76_000096 [Chlamydomonas incerta]|eukprot:KAG2445480.1 hypothetical protein HXX76_000096 [Chlamydomonas incerta]
MATLSIVGEVRDGEELVAAADARSVRSLTGNPDDTRVIARFNWSRSLHTWHSTAGAPPALDDVSAWVPIAGATRPTYRCTPGDVGCWIRATVVPLLRGAAGDVSGGADGSRPFLRAMTGPVLEPLPVGSYSQDSQLGWQVAQQYQQYQQLQPQLAPSSLPPQPQPVEGVVVVEGQYTAVAEGGNRLMVHLSPRQVLRTSSAAGSPHAAFAEAQAQARAGQPGAYTMPPSPPPQGPQAYTGAHASGSTYLTSGYDIQQHSVPVVPQASLHSTWSHTVGPMPSPPRHLYASQSMQSPHGHARSGLDVSLSAAAAASAAAAGGAASAGTRRLHRSATSPEQSRQPQFQPQAAPGRGPEAAALPAESPAYQPQPPLLQQQYQQQPAMHEPQLAVPQAQVQTFQPHHLHPSASMPARPPLQQPTDASATLPEADRARVLHRFATSPDRLRAPGAWSQEPALPPQPSAEMAQLAYDAAATQPFVSVPVPRDQPQEPQEQQLQSRQSVSFGTAAAARQLHRFNTSPDRIRQGSQANAWMAQEPQPPATGAAAQQQPLQPLHMEAFLAPQAPAPAPEQQPEQPASSFPQPAAAYQHHAQQQEQLQQQQRQLHAFASMPPGRAAVQPIQPLPPAHLLTSASAAPAAGAGSSPRRMARSATSPDRGRSPGRWNQIMDPLFNPSGGEASGTVALDAARSPGSFSDFLQNTRAAAANRAAARAPGQAAAGIAGANAAVAAAAGAGAATLREGAMGTPAAPPAAAAGPSGSSHVAGGLDGIPSPLPPQRLEEAFSEHGGSATGDSGVGGGDTLREALDHLLAQHHEAVQQVVLDHALLQQHALAAHLPPPQSEPAPAPSTTAEPGHQATTLAGSSWRAPRASTASEGSSVSLSLSGAPPAPSLAQQPRPEPQQQAPTAGRDAGAGSNTNTSSCSSSGGGAAAGDAGRSTAVQAELQAEYRQQLMQHAQLEEEAQAALRAGASEEEVLQALQALRTRGASARSLGSRVPSQRSMAAPPPPPSFKPQQSGGAVDAPNELLELMAEEAELHEAMESAAAAAIIGAGAGSIAGRSAGTSGRRSSLSGPSALASAARTSTGPGAGQAPGVGPAPEESLTAVRGMNEALMAQLAESSRLQAQMQRALDASVAQLQQMQAQQQRQAAPAEREPHQRAQPPMPPLQAQQAGDAPVSPPHRLAQAASGVRQARTLPQQPSAQQAPAHPAAAAAQAPISAPPSQAAAEQLGAATGDLPIIPGLDPAAAAALRAALQQQHQRWKRKKAKLKEQAQAWQYTAWRYATAWKQSREVVQALLAAQQGSDARLPAAATDSAPPEPASHPPQDFRPLPSRSAPVRPNAPAAAGAAPAQQSAPTGPPPLSPTGLAAGIAALLRSRHNLPVPPAQGPLFPGGAPPGARAPAAAAAVAPDPIPGRAPLAVAPLTAAYTARAARRAVATSAVASGGVMAATVASAARSRSVERARPDKLRAKSPPRPAGAEGRADRVAAAPAPKHDKPEAAMQAAVATGAQADAAAAQTAAAAAGASSGAFADGAHGAGAPLPDVGRARDQTSRGRARSAGRSGREGPGPAPEVAAHWPATLRSSGDGSRPRSPSPDGRPPFKPAVAPSSPPRPHYHNHVTLSVYGDRQPPLPAQPGAHVVAAPPAPGQPPVASGQQWSGYAAPYPHQQPLLDPALADVPRPYRDPQGWWHIPDRWIDVYDPPVHALNIAASGGAQPPRPFTRTQ